MLMNQAHHVNGPDLDEAYATLSAKIRKLDPSVDIPPRKWGYAALRPMEQLLDKLENAAAAARPPTPAQKDLQDINALQNKVSAQMADMVLKGMVNYDMPSMKLLDETHSHEERLSRLRVVKHKLDDIWQEQGLSAEQRAKLALNVARAVRDEHGKELRALNAAGEELGALLSKAIEEFAALRGQVKDLAQRVGHLEQLQAHH
jgi:hypothetical protein